MSKITTSDGVFVENKLTNQSAQEVYDAWLANKDSPSKPTEIELMKQQDSELRKTIDFILTDLIPSLLE